MGGTMWLAGEPVDPPNLPPWKQGYISASIIGAAGTLTALLYRDMHGEGQHVDVSMQEALSLTQETAMQTWDMMEALRCATAPAGSSRSKSPASASTSAATATSSATSARPAARPWGDMLDWMDEEGKAEDLTEEPYRDVFIANLNLRFLTGLIATDPEVRQETRS